MPIMTLPYDSDEEEEEYIEKMIEYWEVNDE